MRNYFGSEVFLIVLLFMFLLTALTLTKLLPPVPAKVIPLSEPVSALSIPKVFSQIYSPVGC